MVQNNYEIEYKRSMMSTGIYFVVIGCLVVVAVATSGKGTNSDGSYLPGGLVPDMPSAD